jgi:ligand-binding SRPBCC domain-containing protein
MEFKISCLVSLEKEKVWESFNQNLLAKLSPPIPKITIIKYEGQAKGNQLLFFLDFIFFKQKWEGIISEDYISTEENYFIDVENGSLPMLLKKWRHKHRIIKTNNNNTLIKDEVKFTTNYILLDILLLPLIYGLFLYRIPIYKSVFKKN